MHSFVYYSFAKHLYKPLKFLNYDLFVVVPLGASSVSSSVFRTCEVKIYGMELAVDLISLVIQYFNVILGINLLMTNWVVIDCENKWVLF